MNYTVRPIRTADIAEYLALTNHINKETDFLGTSPNDPTPSPMQLAMMIKTGRQIIFVAEHENGSLIAHLGAFWRRGQGEKLKHSMCVGLGVAKDFWRLGIGNALFAAFESWAAEAGVTRLELEVMTHNEAGIALYKKRGFEIEGTKRNSIKLEDRYIDEHLMSKLL